MTKNPKRVLGGKTGHLRVDLSKAKWGFIIGCIFLTGLTALAWCVNAWTSYSIIVPGVLTILGILMEGFTFLRTRREIEQLTKKRQELQNNPSHHTTESRAEARLPVAGER